ncbi:MAG: hypothetical protein LUD47_06815 [Clostridia bacterium]|nr:hypothetical protein [Clostridia bacterium]
MAGKADIEGFAEMTDAEKISALEKALSDSEKTNSNMQSEISKWKKASDKSAGEAADYKNRLREKQSEDERQKEEQAQQLEALLEENKKLKTEKQLAEFTAKYVALGYDEALAKDTAQAMVEGDADKVFANNAKHLEAVKQAVQADLTKETPRPEGGEVMKKPKTREEIMKITDYGELMEAIHNNPEAFNNT